MLGWSSDEEETEEPRDWWHAPALLPLLRYLTPPAPTPDPHGLGGGLALSDAWDGQLSLPDSRAGQPLLGDSLMGQPVLGDARMGQPLLPDSQMGQRLLPDHGVADPLGWSAETAYRGLETVENTSVDLFERTGVSDMGDEVEGLKTVYDEANALGSIFNFLKGPMRMDPEDAGRFLTAAGSLATDGTEGFAYDSMVRASGNGNVLETNKIVGYPMAKAYNFLTGQPTPRPASMDLIAPLADLFVDQTLAEIDPYVQGAEKGALTVAEQAGRVAAAPGNLAEATARAAMRAEVPGGRNFLDDVELHHDVGSGYEIGLPDWHPDFQPKQKPPGIPDSLSLMPVDPMAPWSSIDPPMPGAPAPVSVDHPSLHVAPDPGTSMVPFDPNGFALTLPEAPGPFLAPIDDAITPVTLPQDPGVHMPSAGALTPGRLGTAAGVGGATGAGLSLATDAFRGIVLGEDVSLGEVAGNAAFGAATGAAGDVGQEIVGQGLTRAIGSELVGNIAGGGVVDAAIAGVGSTLSNGAAIERGEIDAAHATANVAVDVGVGLAGGLAGAGTGALIGSAACPVFGTAIGAGLGFVGGALGSMGVSMLADGTGFTDWAKQGIGDNLGFAETPLSIGWSGVNGAIDGAMTGVGAGAAGGAAMGAIGTGASMAALGFCMGGPLGALALGGLGAGVGAAGGALIGGGLGLVPGLGIGAGMGFAEGMSDWWNGTNVPPKPEELTA